MNVHGYSPNETVEEALAFGIRCNICWKAELFRKIIPVCRHGQAITELDPVYVCKDHVAERPKLLQHQALIKLLQHRAIICSQRQ